eukprot:TRINITY_DN83441_c0_g1_i1.p1 TRINITY_DN83441_c0_g1~~TRINITY_DN83441_c0_g1_i1.p1  ORF type:complete len:225 (+),score=46.04 TRINITY_DN83441_c0_g1_i1:67-675(+)
MGLECVAATFGPAIFGAHLMPRALRCAPTHTVGRRLRSMSSSARPPLPPFSHADATLKVRMAEDAWNTRDPAKVSLAYTEDCVWRNRGSFLQGREAIVSFLEDKWAKEQEYRLIKELFAVEGHRIAVCFQYEFKQRGTGIWFRAYGNENWDFAPNGLMCRRQASINDVQIVEAERRFTWRKLGPRPEDFPGLAELEAMRSSS